MTDAELIERAQSVLEVESRAELEHLLTCGDCYLFDQDDGGGPHFCRAFRIEFRGWVAPEQSASGLIPAVWSAEILEALRRQRF